MKNINSTPVIIGISTIIGLSILGFSISNAIIKFKTFDRSVTVKGLSERFCQANLANWTISFSSTANDLVQIYNNVNKNINEIMSFLSNSGIQENCIIIPPNFLTDKFTLSYGAADGLQFRYVAKQNILVSSTNITLIQKLQTELPNLGKKGIVFSGNEYVSPVNYVFTNLNAVKPEMVMEATQNAREVALKFAEDSKSKLGKIKNASQGQFIIQDSDQSSPHIKLIRVVSTVEYYLRD
ncbi:MAG: SIMPL domain-containing protein [Brevinemataceae bacterium]